MIFLGEIFTPHPSNPSISPLPWRRARQSAHTFPIVFPYDFPHRKRTAFFDFPVFLLFFPERFAFVFLFFSGFSFVYCHLSISLFFFAPSSAPWISDVTDLFNMCQTNATVLVGADENLKSAIVIIQLIGMGIVLLLSALVYRQRKSKAIASSMWTVLECVLLGQLILFNTVTVASMEPSRWRCVLEPWIREIGFVLCYGAVTLLLYRHLVEFRTRKAHRWVVKDTDLLKYLLVMLSAGAAYMAAFTALIFDFLRDDFPILEMAATGDGDQFQACKRLWWDYVTVGVEMSILTFAVRLAYASRNARAQFHERTLLCACVILEMATSVAFHAFRATFPLHPDTVLIICCVRTQTSQTVSALLIFAPKFCYQKKQVRTLAQEYSCRFPLDAFKEQSSDVEIGECSVADMSPDDIRTELKRLYLQLELYKAKDVCKDNPHISKRRGGRKTAHRKFSLQQTNKRHKDQKKDPDTEITEAEPSRTPEDSVCSNEGPSAIYADLP